MDLQSLPVFFSRICRWGVRKGLGRFPSKRKSLFFGSPRLIDYMIAGSYGDVAQSLIAIRTLAKVFPGARIFLHLRDRYFRAFESEFPSNVAQAGLLRSFTRLLRPSDMLITNAVGVYRVRFELAGRFLTRAAFGFRYQNEPPRKSYFVSLPLHSDIRNFSEENLRLLGCAVEHFMGRDMDILALPSKREDVDVPRESLHDSLERGVLFHIGSVGMKKILGLQAYASLIEKILVRLRRYQVECVVGPDDGDITALLRAFPKIEKSYSIPGLITRLGVFEGQVICFDSFMAHLCKYLDRRAVVMFPNRIPFGYDCAPLHRQVLLRQEDGWDPEPLFENLGI